VEAGATLARLRPAGEPERPVPGRATPLARRIAAVNHIDLAALTGSGPDGRVVAADVRGMMPHVGPKHSPNEITASAELPAANASALQTPIATVTIEFDAGAALVRAGLMVCVAVAAAGLLPRHRLLNARWGEEGIWLRRRLHLAVAVPAGQGLAWTLVRDAGDLTLRGMARALSAKPGPDAPGDATIAFISLADGATWQSAPPPLAGTVAALGLGAPRRRAVACGGALLVRPVAALTLSYDARALDHSHAVAFLRGLRDALEGL
jgi:pyruvate/2-oxoglutarate dehydrogenase complex dihydrolipoamide acyltransferase (E2) component